MLPFESELKEFRRGVEEIKEELEDSIEIDRNANIEDFLHRIIAQVSDFAYMAEGADPQALEFLNQDWPARSLAEIKFIFHRLLRKIPLEFQQIFRIELSELFGRIQFYVQIPEEIKYTSSQASSASAKSVAQNNAWDMLHAEGLRQAFVKHFAAWCHSAYCEEMLHFIAGALTRAQLRNGELSLNFKSSEPQELTASFGEPYGGEIDKLKAGTPTSYAEVITLHGRIIIQAGAARLEMEGYDSNGPRSGFGAKKPKGDPNRFIGFCNAGEQWFIFDTTKRNKLGEPRMMLARSDKGAIKIKELPSQQFIAYGVGGLLLRCIGYKLYPEAMMFKGFAW